MRSARCVLGFSLFLRFTVLPLHAFSLSLSSHFLDYVSNDDQLSFLPPFHASVPLTLSLPKYHDVLIAVEKHPLYPMLF